MNNLAALEGLLFVVGDEGLTMNQIKEILNVNDEDLKELISTLRKKYEQEESGIYLVVLGNSFKLATKKEYKDYYVKLIENPETNILSNAALETLAIMAYNQPITRVKVDEIRGVYSGPMIRKLVAKGLIKEIGRSDTPGRPILYATTGDFLDYFGMSSLEELPEVNITSENINETKDLYKLRYQD